jgi:hypothetical protein
MNHELKRRLEEAKKLSMSPILPIPFRDVLRVLWHAVARRLGWKEDRDAS